VCMLLLMLRTKLNTSKGSILIFTLLLSEQNQNPKHYKNLTQQL
jgi:hypothetical protein